MQRQIEEKNRKKEEEKARERELNAREEARLRNEAQPQYEPNFFKRKTAYNNHNQISIVGSGGPNSTSFPNN